ncbi:hypothetical protein INT45_003497 [Circinella minor]|uniref:Uncharacterized protein n=1 Tax=Circinella minor TaxID=1195481 RepID=A0A8H7S820_9FUNG|nr:hypothetical protein INT45_003497 [Circinella minor]
MKLASITSAIVLMVVATSALPHGGHTSIGGSNGQVYNGGLGNGIAKAGVGADNSKKSSTNVVDVHHRRSYGGDYHGHGHGHDHDHDDDFEKVVVGGSNEVTYNGGAANGAAAGGLLSDNHQVSTTNIHTHDDEHDGHDIYVKGNNGKQFNGGLLNGLAEGGVAADNSKKSSTNVVDVHHRRSYGGNYHGHGHGHDHDHDYDFEKVVVGGSNEVTYNGGAANGAAAGGLLSDNHQVSTTNIHTHDDEHDGHDIYVKGNNGKQFNNGALNGAVEAGVLSNNKKEAYTSIVIDEH